MKHTLTNTEWTLIGDDVTSITFQNVGQYAIYINFNSSNTAPSEEYGLIYTSLQGELKRPTTELTYKSTPNYVFAKAASRSVDIYVETG